MLVLARLIKAGHLLLGGVVWAGLSFKLFGRHDTVASLDARTTSMTARRPFGPFGHSAVHGVATRLDLAGSALAGAVVGARLAAELGGADSAVAVLLARTTRHGAMAPFGPLGDIAVDRAGLSVARTLVVLGQTNSALLASSSGLLDGSLSRLDTITASHAALAPRRPSANNTVARAGLRVTHTGLLGVRLLLCASLASELGILDGSLSVLHASIARSRALAPLAPVAHGAVNRTRIIVADTSLLELEVARALLATMLSGSGSASADLVTATAGLVARGPLRPLRDGAVNSTGLHLALACLLHSDGLTVGSALGGLQLTSALLSTSTAGY